MLSRRVMRKEEGSLLLPRRTEEAFIPTPVAGPDQRRPSGGDALLPQQTTVSITRSLGPRSHHGQSPAALRTVSVRQNLPSRLTPSVCHPATPASPSASDLSLHHTPGATWGSIPTNGALYPADHHWCDCGAQTLSRLGLGWAR